MYQILLLFLTIVSIINTNEGTPLDDYVYKPDPAFTWKLIETQAKPTYTLFILNMTSQQWLDASFSSQSIWWHYIIITVPTTITRPNTALMLINGGNNNDPVPTGSDVTSLALASGSVAVEVQQIPNQPITFAADPLQQNRTEDSIVSWTWNTFIESNGSDPVILLQLPMTKAVIRAMETTQQFLYEKELSVPDKFVISGFSKRGWAAWLTAAVDNSRVAGAIPVVFDILNLQKNMKHHYRSLAGWTFAFAAYYMENITRNLDNPYFQAMADIIDPYAYFNRYRYVKLLQIQAADDEFFLPDSEDYFWDDLQNATGGTLLSRIPNVGHQITGFDESLGSFYGSICDKQVLPSWTWTRTTNATHGEIRANVSTGDGHPAPINVTVYQARTVTGTKRDFRRAKVDPNTKTVVPNPVKWVEVNNTIGTSKIGESIIYTYVAPMPPAGYWDGIFMQVTFPGPQNTSLNLTTETLTIPDTFPLDPCSGEQCYGTLV